MHFRRLSLLALLSLTVSPALAQAQANKTYTFTGGFTDGSRVDIEPLQSWQQRGSNPVLGNKPLFDPKNPVRWIKSRTDELPSAPQAYVEYLGGDVLPGRVTSYDTILPGAGEQAPHLAVEPDISLDLPNMPKRELHVSTRHLRRIVWERRRQDQYQPGTLFYRDGRQMGFRSIRFTPIGVLALQAQERVEVTFGEIAELHFPAANPWEAYLDHAALLAVEPATRLWRMCTLDGLVVTTSSERLMPSGQGDGGNWQTWFHGVQPAWAFDPLWVPLRRLYQAQSFAPHEPPASMIAPQRSVQRSQLAGGRAARIDRNVNGESLESGGRPFGWGVGVHAYSEVTWDLPPMIRAFRTQLGLDSSVGRGGCVKCKITAGDAGGQALYESKHLVGSEEVHDTGRLALDGADQGQKQITLVVDPAMTDRPAGSDPLDVRDTLNWLEPTFELDADKLRAELAARRLKAAPDWEGWTSAEPDKLGWANRWELGDGQTVRLYFEAKPLDSFVTMSRSVKIGADDNWLRIGVNRNPTDNLSTPARIQFRIDGRSIIEAEVPKRGRRGESRPVVVPIEKYRGKTVQLEAVVMAQGQHPYIHWGPVVTSPTIPGLLTVLEDQPPEGTQVVATGEAALDAAAAYSGGLGLKVAGKDSAGKIELPGIKIRERPGPGEYRAIYFVWRKTNGKEIALDLGFDANATPHERNATGLVYHAGAPRPMRRSRPRAIRVADVAPEGWTVVQRDLFGDFGSGDLTSLTLTSPDGEAALLDSVYLGRGWEGDPYVDFARCPPPNDRRKHAPFNDPDLVGVATEPVGYGQIMNEHAPQFSVGYVSWSGLGVVKAHFGKQNVLRTDPQVDRVAALRAPLAVPKDKKTRLRLSVSHKAGADWHLYIKVGQEQLYGTAINEQTAKNNHWHDVEVDLSKFAGQKIVLELQNGVSGANSWDLAYWSGIEIVSE